MKITGGESVGKLGVEAFAQYLAINCDYDIRDFKALFAPIEMVPLLMGDHPQIMDFVDWRLQLGK